MTDLRGIAAAPAQARSMDGLGLMVLVARGLPFEGNRNDTGDLSITWIRRTCYGGV